MIVLYIGVYMHIGMGEGAIIPFGPPPPPPQRFQDWNPHNLYMNFHLVLLHDEFLFVIVVNCMYLKALFNNVFTLNNLSVSCMSLHAISVFDKMYKINEN